MEFKFIYNTLNLIDEEHDYKLILLTNISQKISKVIHHSHDPSTCCYVQKTIKKIINDKKQYDSFYKCYNKERQNEIIDKLNAYIIMKKLLM